MDQQVVLVIGTEEIIINREWIPRWRLLTDIVSEPDMLVDGRIVWTATGIEEVRWWVTINKLIDYNESRNGSIKAIVESIFSMATIPLISQQLDDAIASVYGVTYTPRLPPQLVQLSQCWNTVRYMNPTTDLYLLFCHIDQKLELEDRRILYDALGRFVRESGVRPSYAQICYSGIHNNMRLWKDCVYEFYEDDKCKESSFSSFIQKAIIDSDLNVLTGIMHTAYQLTIGPEVGVELPWYHIRWNDVVAFGHAKLPVDKEKGYSFDHSNAFVDWLMNDECIILHFLNGSGLVDLTKDGPYQPRLSATVVDMRTTVPIDNFSGLLEIIVKNMARSHVELYRVLIDRLEGLTEKTYNMRLAAHYVDNRPIAYVLNVLLRTCWDMPSDSSTCELYKDFCYRMLYGYNYPLIVTRIADTLGTSFLQAFVNIITHNMAERKTYKNLLSFSKIAQQEIDRRGALTGFQQWPKV